jgi:hypothetical protein
VDFRKYRLDKANEALHDLKGGKIIGIPVLSSLGQLLFRLTIGLAAHMDIKV